VAIVETELGAPVDNLFERFDREPMASASVAQVHGARLREGREVVVKVIRPGIEGVIRKDLALLALLAGLVERFLPTAGACARWRS
jgi:ubiquinone biosynthesis protein